MSATPEPAVDLPRQENMKDLIEEGDAPRYDLDVPRRCCRRTLRELIRRRWKRSEIADYCRVRETDVEEKLGHLPFELASDGGPPSNEGGSQVLWYTHPNQVDQLIQNR